VRRWWLERGGLVAASAFAVYVWLAPAHVVDGDNAEFSGLAALGGIAHPSGYPAYVLWLRAWSWLPGTPAHAAALATAALAALAIFALHAACRAWGARPLAATVACALFAGSPLWLRVATEAEVFAPNCLIAALVLWLAAKQGPLHGGARAAALGVVAGVGLANHLTCALLAPIGIYGLVRAAREARPRVLGLAALGLAVGLGPYAYALVAPDTPLSWGHVRDLDGLVGLALRRDYGTGSLVAHGAGAPIGASLGALAGSLARAWLWLPLAAALYALATRLARRRDDGEPRLAWLALVASFVLAGPVLVARFNAAPTGIGLYIVHRFHVLPVLLLAIPVAVGLGDLAAKLRERALSRLAQPIAATLGLAAATAASLPALARVHSPALEAYARNTLVMLPPGAVVIVSPDAFYFGANYEQWACGVRPDVTVVGWPLLASAWYRERAAELGIVGDDIDAPARVQLAHHLVATGRPVFFEPDASDVVHAFPSYPYGPLVRVLPRGTAPPRLDAVVAGELQIYAQFDLPEAQPGPDDEWATVVHERYAATWLVLARALAAAHEPEAAARATEIARQIGPAP
jgi:hypothetical protein